MISIPVGRNQQNAPLAPTTILPVSTPPDLRNENKRPVKPCRGHSRWALDHPKLVRLKDELKYTGTKAVSHTCNA